MVARARRSGATSSRYLTTLEVARQLRVTKQTVLNWLYAGKISEPPRSKTNYRLWTESRVALLKKLIAEFEDDDG